MTDRSGQIVQMAHLRPLPRCRECGAPATEELRNGINDLVSVHCTRHAAAALKRFKGKT